LLAFVSISDGVDLSCKLSGLVLPTCTVHIKQMMRINRRCCLVADVASEHRKAALQSVVTLLPDENREALHCLLIFLNRLADYAAQNQVRCRLLTFHQDHLDVLLCQTLPKWPNCLSLCIYSN